jgi:hypothetical protein
MEFHLRMDHKIKINIPPTQIKMGYPHQLIADILRINTTLIKYRREEILIKEVGPNKK